LDGEKVFFKDQVLKVWHANADARLHVARKTKAPDDWDSPYESYDPYGPGGVAGDEFIDDRNSVTARCNAVTAGNRFLVVARPRGHPPRARNGLLPRRLLVSRNQLDKLAERGYLDPDDHLAADGGDNSKVITMSYGKAFQREA
jgi:hypothetical protein